jgi:plastocyanin
MRPNPAVLLAVCGLFTVSLAHAGQVRIRVSDVVGANKFVPSAISLNRGDQVVWQWVNGEHSVTSGSNCLPTSNFDSGTWITDLAAGTMFSWKSDVTGPLAYMCLPHCDMNMVATLSIAASGVQVSDLRITEVQYNPPTGEDLIEIANLGGAAGDLGRCRFVASSDTATVPLDSYAIAANARVRVHVHTSGTQTATDLFLPTLQDLPDSASLALYAPNTVNTNLADVSQIIDFVEWGKGGQGQEATAVNATFWNSGAFLPTVPPGHSIEFCGATGQYGFARWSEITTPNFGSNGGCSTPTRRVSWAQLKLIYR